MNHKLLTVERVTEFDSELINKLTEIEEEVFGDGGLNRWTFPVFIRHGAVYVLRCDGEVCGIADLIRDWADLKLVFIVNFVIAKGSRGKALAAIFLRKLIEKLRADDVNKLQLTVAPDNIAAIHLYDKIGFKQVAELSNEYGTAVDRLLYELELEE